MKNSTASIQLKNLFSKVSRLFVTIHYSRLMLRCMDQSSIPVQEKWMLLRKQNKITHSTKTITALMRDRFFTVIFSPSFPHTTKCACSKEAKGEASRLRRRNIE